MGPAFEHQVVGVASLRVQRVRRDDRVLQIVDALAQHRNIGISLVLRSTLTCPRTTALRWSIAASRCRASVVSLAEPRTVLPSRARTRAEP
jgi:hypothetical protein